MKVTYPVPIMLKQLHKGPTPEAPKLIVWLCLRSNTLLIETSTLMTFLLPHLTPTSVLAKACLTPRQRALYPRNIMSIPSQYLASLYRGIQALSSVIIWVIGLC